MTRDLVEDVLKYKRLDGVDAALRAIRGGFAPGGKQARNLREYRIERIWEGTSEIHRDIIARDILRDYRPQ